MYAQDHIRVPDDPRMIIPRLTNLGFLGFDNRRIYCHTLTLVLLMDKLLYNNELYLGYLIPKHRNLILTAGYDNFLSGTDLCLSKDINMVDQKTGNWYGDPPKSVKHYIGIQECTRVALEYITISNTKAFFDLFPKLEKVYIGPAVGQKQRFMRILSDNGVEVSTTHYPRAMRQKG
jgi:hypothetical protein